MTPSTTFPSVSPPQPLSREGLKAGSAVMAQPPQHSHSAMRKRCLHSNYVWMTSMPRDLSAETKSAGASVSVTSV